MQETNTINNYTINNFLFPKESGLKIIYLGILIPTDGKRLFTPPKLGFWGI